MTLSTIARLAVGGLLLAATGGARPEGAPSPGPAVAAGPATAAEQPSPAASPRPSPRPAAKPMPVRADVKLPASRRVVLPNGLTLLLMEQHEVPMVSFSVSVAAGAVLDPPGKEGLASITAELLRKGTKRRSADAIAEAIDSVGGSFGFDADADRAQGAAEFLARDADAAVALLADLVQQPTFPDDEVAKATAQRIDGIRQAKDQPRAVLGDFAHAFLYGDHVYGRPEGGDERSLAAISPGDVRAFHAARYGPAVTVIAAVGDFASAAMEERLRSAFGGWTRDVMSPPPVPDLVAPAGRRLLLVDKPDATQTFFSIGAVGLRRSDPDRVAVDVVNTVFGGRFTSILNSALRIESGLTYGARSSFDLRRAAGPFAITSYTRNETTVKAIDMALDLLKGLHERGLSDEQLRSAKAYIRGQFPPELETSAALAATLTELEFFGLGSDEIDRYLERVDAVTADDVRRVVQSHFPLESLSLTLIGKADEIGSQVQKYAPEVKRRGIAEPGFR